MEAATLAARADKELRAQQSMSAQHQRLLRQATADASPPTTPCCFLWRYCRATSAQTQTHLFYSTAERGIATLASRPAYIWP